MITTDESLPEMAPSTATGTEMEEASAQQFADALPGKVLPAATQFTRAPIGAIAMDTRAGRLTYECSTDTKTGGVLIRSNLSGQWYLLPLSEIIAMAQYKGVDLRDSPIITEFHQGLIV